MALLDTRIKQVSLALGEYEIAAKTILDSSNVEKTWEDIEALLSKTGRVVVLDALPEATKAAYDEYKDALVLIPGPDSADYKDEYVIIREGTGTYTYKWEKVGNTHIDLSGYALKGDYVSDEQGAHVHAATVDVDTYTSTDKKLAANRTTDVALDTTSKKNAITSLGEASTDSVLGADATFAVTGGEAITSRLVKADVIPAVANGNASKVTIGTSTAAASKVTESTQTVAECDTAVTVADGLTDGNDLMVSATVNDGVLSFGYKALNTKQVIPAKAKTIGAYSFADVDIPTVSAVDVEVAKVGTAVAFATGAVAADGDGATIATGISSISVAADNKDAVTAVTGYAAPVAEPVLANVTVATQPVITLDGNASTGLDYVAAVVKGEATTVTVDIESAGAHTHTTKI